MEFIILSVIIAILSAGVLIWGFLQTSAPAQDAATADMAVYREQLREVERDVARGVLSAEDAERVRTEVSRRLLAADAAAQKATASSRGPVWAGVALAAVALIGGVVLYERVGQPGLRDLGLSARLKMAEEIRNSRISQDEAEKIIATRPVTEEPTADEAYLKLVEKLRSEVNKRPDDLQGHILLARSEANLGNFIAARAAQETVLSLLGDKATAQDYVDYADIQIRAVDGYVSPQAEAALQAALTRDKQNGQALFLYGLMMEQTGRPDIAFRMWDQALRIGPEDANWFPTVRKNIPQMAQLAGVDYEAPAMLKGPTAEDMANAAQMSQGDRTEMIRGMVAQLSERLATEGGTPEEWARLVSSYGVLGDKDQAAKIWAEAQTVFAGKDAALATVRAAAENAGVAE